MCDRVVDSDNNVPTSLSLEDEQATRRAQDMKTVELREIRYEALGRCCSGGKVHFSSFEPYPEPHSLLTHQDSMAGHFISVVQKCNGCFRIVSLEAREVKERNLNANAQCARTVILQNGKSHGGFSATTFIPSDLLYWL